MTPAQPLYYLGRPCPRGHISNNGKTKRYTSNYKCILCWAEKYLERKAKKATLIQNRYGDPHG